MNILIAAVARNGVIGLHGELPWSIPADLRRFKELTDGHPVVMGRVTFESIGHPLAGRTNIVLSRDRGYQADGVEVASNVEAAIEIAKNRHGADAELYVIGGGAVYEQFLSRADRLELTLVDAAPNGDAWFPKWNEAEWREVGVDVHEGSPPFEFKTFERSEPAKIEQA